MTRMPQRILGVYESGVPGPTLICMGGIHGNEPAGVHALYRVLEALAEKGAPLRGRLVAMAGNLAALGREQRFIERDLNRAWSADEITELLGRPPDMDHAEDREQRELIAALDQCQAEARGPLLFLDLHTSSAPGASFSCMSDTLANRRIAFALPIPVILGLEECIDGACMEYFNRRGMIAMAVEGGRHQDPVSIDNLEAAVWLVLDAARMLPSGQVDLDACRATLSRSAAGQPPVLEILHRQQIAPGETFRMDPGFESFQPVKKGQRLGESDGEPLTAPRDCLVLLPLYQGQGDDGYFLVRPVPRFWLRVAAILRRLRLAAILHWLPGVRRQAGESDALIVEPRIARLFAVELLHLLGFRRQRTFGGQLHFSRRRDPSLD